MMVDMSTNESSSQTARAATTEDGRNMNSDEEKEGPSASDNVPTTLNPPRKAHGFVWLLIVASIVLANFLFATDNTIAANIQPAIVKDFESLDKLAWLAVAFFASSWGTNLLWYVFGCGYKLRSLILTEHRRGDIYSRFSNKWTFCSSFIVFAVGSAVYGAAPTMNALIVGRAICGVGGAGM